MSGSVIRSPLTTAIPCGYVFIPHPSVGFLVPIVTPFHSPSHRRSFHSPFLDCFFCTTRHDAIFREFLRKEKTKNVKKAAFFHFFIFFSKNFKTQDIPNSKLKKFDVGRSDSTNSRKGMHSGTLGLCGEARFLHFLHKLSTESTEQTIKHRTKTTRNGHAWLWSPPTVRRGNDCPLECALGATSK